MVKGYSDGKAVEALAKAAGDRNLAAQILMAWSEADPKLREALLAPFLKSLCAYAVQRAARSGKKPASNAKGKPADAVDAVVAALGKSSATSRSFGVPERTPRKQIAGSAKHEQSVRALATAFRAKRRSP